MTSQSRDLSRTSDMYQHAQIEVAGDGEETVKMIALTTAGLGFLSLWLLNVRVISYSDGRFCLILHIDSQGRRKFKRVTRAIRN